VIEEPLFPGYVFVRIDGSHASRLAVRKAHGVAGFVGAQGRGVPIPDNQIEDIQSILASDVPFTLFPFLEVGHRVRIRGGCLDGVEGILLCKNTDRSLLVSIDLIQRSLAVRVDGFEVEPIKWNNSAGRPAEVRAF
jgi:transcriptional antiterminator RfaH